MVDVHEPYLRCIACHKEMMAGATYVCPDCTGELEVLYDYDGLARTGCFKHDVDSGHGMWQKFRQLLPVTNESAIVSLGEGNTPLVQSQQIAKDLGLKALFFKLESCNATGSFKDRQISTGISKAKELGSGTFCITSSGNAGAAMSAYSAKIGAEAYVWLGEGTPLSKIRQIQVYGSQLFLVKKSNRDVSAYHDAYVNMNAFCHNLGYTPMITSRSSNPYTVEGSKTIAFEIVDQLGWKVPDYVCAPVGGGGLVGGNWKAFRELQAIGLIDELPQMVGAQYGAEARVPIDQLEAPGFDRKRYFEPIDGRWAMKSISESGGALVQTTKDECHQAQILLAQKEGILGEPAGIASFVGLVKAVESGSIDLDSTIVCYITGTGLKDDQSTQRIAQDVACIKPILQVSSLEDSLKHLRETLDQLVTMGVSS